MLNRVCIMGRLTGDVEYKLTTPPREVPVANFGLAVERNYKNEKSGERAVDFFNVTAWRGLADFSARYLHKGERIVVEGRLEVSPWTDKDGNKRRPVIIVAENIYFADSKRTADGEPSAEDFGSDEGAPPECPGAEEEGSPET